VFGKNSAEMSESLCAQVNEVHKQLCQVIYELENLCALDSATSSQDPPSIEAAILLGRKIAPTTISPTFIRFNSEVGPLEPMPSRFRVPFPTMEDFKFSVLNFQRPIEASVQAVPERVTDGPKKVDDEYADDF
jgi:hypothetical protein